MSPIVLPSDTLTEAGIKMLRQQLDRFMQYADSLPLLDNPEPVHRMRVASRRMRAVLRVFGEGLGPWANAVKDHLAGIAAELGIIRDSDVYRAFLNAYTHRDCPPELRRSVRAMALAEHRFRYDAIGPLIEHIGSEDHAVFIAAFRREMEDHLVEEARLDSASRVPLSKVAPKLLRRGIKDVLSYDRPLRKCSSDELHALRIACKRLRYTSEFLAPLYADNLASVHAPALAMHRFLGDVHDADVYRRRLKTALHGKPRLSAAKTAAIKALDAHLKAWRRDQLLEAVAVWQQFTNRGCIGARASVKRVSDAT